MESGEQEGRGKGVVSRKGGREGSGEQEGRGERVVSRKGGGREL